MNNIQLLNAYAPIHMHKAPVAVINATIECDDIGVVFPIMFVSNVHGYWYFKLETNVFFQFVLMVVSN